jgi:DNA polymerase
MSCDLCPTLCASRTQIVLATPAPLGGLLAIGEAPGAEEDQLGEGFIGRAGRTLDTLLARHGISRSEYGRANICRCRPPNNRKPEKSEIAACLPNLASLILEARPKVLLLVGGTPTTVFFGAGTLFSHIQAASLAPAAPIEPAHPDLKSIRLSARSPRAIPMPHTSPLAFNRFAPDGRKWAAIAEEQIALAVKMLKD